MPPQRKIIVYIASSADGYIARPDGNVDWLNRPGTSGDYGMKAFYRSIDTILWGRKTYEVAIRFQKAGVKGAGFDRNVKNYVFSHKLPKRPTPGIEFANEQISTFANRLRAAQGKNIWMMGGAGIIASFLDEGQIDEFIIHVIPAFIGEGIPLMQPRGRNVALVLKSVRRFADGVVRLHYVMNQRSVGRRVR